MMGHKREYKPKKTTRVLLNYFHDKVAHCLVNNLIGIGRFQIVVGQHFVSNANRSGREQFREISLEIHHPRFNGGASDNDIALIRFESPLQFNQLNFLHNQTSFYTLEAPRVKRRTKVPVSNFSKFKLC